MKRILTLTLVFILAFTILAGCSENNDDRITPGSTTGNNPSTVTPSNEDPSTKNPSAEDNKTKTTLRVAMAPDLAPMGFVDPTKSGQNQFVGFDVSLAKFIAKELDMELMIVPLDFDACLDAVSDGDVDISISGYSWTTERARDYNLSDFYYPGNRLDGDLEEHCVVVLQKGNDKLTSNVNKALAKALDAGYYKTWYEEALNTEGIEVPYDKHGKPLD